MDTSEPVSTKAMAEIDHSLDGESRTTYILSLVTAACVLSTAAVAARIYTRLCVLHTFGRDDFVMAIAQVLTLMTAATIFLETSYGLGRHTWVMAASYEPYMKSFFASIIIFNLGTCIVKISILFQYRRIFQVPLMNRLTVVVLILEGAWALTLSVLLPLVCTPVSAFWDMAVPGKCLNQLAIWYVMAALNLVTDFVIFSMPLPVIKNLHLPTRQKVMLMGVFCLGFGTCIISVYRITTLKAAANATDPAWENTDAAVWSFLELALGVVAACLPTLKPLFAMVLPHVFKSTLTSRAKVRSGNQYKSDDDGRAMRGTKSLKPGRSSHYNAGGAVYLKDVDDDMDALSLAWGRGSASPAGQDVEMQAHAYNVSVTGGHAKGRVPDFGGIHTTTVVTQRVESM